MAQIDINPFGNNGRLPDGYPIVNDLDTNDAQKSLSAAMGKKLKGFIKKNQAIDFSQYETAGSINTDDNADKNKWYNLSGYKCALIPVEPLSKISIKGHAETYRTAYAVLTSDTHTAGTLAAYATGFTECIRIPLDETIEITIPADGRFLYVTLYSTADISPQSVSGEADKFLTDEDISGLQQSVEGQYEDVNIPAQMSPFISSTQNKWIAPSGSYKSVLIPVTAGDKYKITANDNYICEYAVLTSDNHTAGSAPSYASGYTALRNISAGETAIIEIPQGGAYLYMTTYTTHSLMPKFFKKVVVLGLEEKMSAKIEEYAENQDTVTFPQMLHVGEPTNIIYTIDDFLLAHEYDESQGIDNIKFSNDLGKTWFTKVNEFGVIVNAFLFADGTLLIGSKKADGCRIYWTRDFATFVFQEATVLDYDGNPYTLEAGKTRFYTPVLQNNHVYIDGTEYYCFWDYIISTTNARAWYALSDENGVTVRAAFAFNISQIDGVTIPARHVHFFGYNKFNGYFYILTGDHNNTECNVMRGRHTNHAWTWERLAYGQEYKLIMPAFDEGNMYAVTDYTDNYLANAKGVLSVPIDDIDYNRFKYLFKADATFMAEGSSSPNHVGLAWYLVDNHGWRIIKTDYLGNEKILLAHKNHNYAWVGHDMTGFRFTNMVGPNNNGDVYTRVAAIGSSVGDEAWLHWSGQKTYNFTKMMRDAGAKDFFKDWYTTLY